MKISINAISTYTDNPPYISVHKIQDDMKNDVCIQQLKEYIVEERASNRNEIPKTFNHTGISGKI